MPPHGLLGRLSVPGLDGGRHFAVLIEAAMKTGGVRCDSTDHLSRNAQSNAVAVEIMSISV